MQVVPSKVARDLTAREINFDLNALVCWGKKWHIKPAKSSALCISLKRDLQDHPSLVMDDIPIVEVETLSVLGFRFDRHLTWAAMIDKMVSRSRQCLGWLRRILDYLDSNTLQLAYKALIRPIMEYGNVAIMDAIVPHSWVGLMLFRMLLPVYAEPLLFLFNVVVMLLQLDCC